MEYSSKRILKTTGFLLSMLLVSCTIQKRTLQPGFHIQRIGALNKQPSLQMKVPEIAGLPALPNESVGFSYSPLVAEALAKDGENWNQQKDLKGLAAATPPQYIGSGGLQHALRHVRCDSTDTFVIDGQASASDEALQNEANLLSKLAWYNTNWLWVSILVWPIFLLALTCRLIDKQRMKNGEEPMSWKSKTIFFTVLMFFFAWYVWNFGSLGGPWGFSSFSFRF